MAAAVLDLIGDRAIEQGSYWGLSIYYPGDITGATVRGLIKDQVGGQTLATFKTLPVVFNPETGKSLIHLYLTSGDTRRIKAPQNNFVYDCLLVVPGTLESPVRLIQGIGNVSLGVTDA